MHLTGHVKNYPNSSFFTNFTVSHIRLCPIRDYVSTSKKQVFRLMPSSKRA